MSYGLIIKNSEDKAFISPNITPMNFIKRVDLTIDGGTVRTARFNTGIPCNYVILPFIRVININSRDPYWAPIRMLELTSENGMHVITLQKKEQRSISNVEVYLFSNFVPKLTKYGLEIYNENQEMVYNNACLPLEFSFMKKPDVNLFGEEYGYKKRDSIMIDLGFPVAAISTSYGLKSFHVGAQNGHITYYIFSTAIDTCVGLHLQSRDEGKYRGVYPKIGDIAYIDTRKYQ